MNSHVILAVECVGIPVASALSQNIEALQVTLATLPKDHTSYRAFSLDIEQLQRDIALYVSGEAQKSQVSNAASIERDIGALINDRVAEY